VNPSQLHPGDTALPSAIHNHLYNLAGEGSLFNTATNTLNQTIRQVAESEAALRAMENTSSSCTIPGRDPGMASGSQRRHLNNTRSAPGTPYPGVAGPLMSYSVEDMMVVDSDTSRSNISGTPPNMAPAASSSPFHLLGPDPSGFDSSNSFNTMNPSEMFMPG
jgi:hypothetical protein